MIGAATDILDSWVKLAAVTGTASAATVYMIRFLFTIQRRVESRYDALSLHARQDVAHAREDARAARDEVATMRVDLDAMSRENVECERRLAATLNRLTLLEHEVELLKGKGKA